MIVTQKEFAEMVGVSKQAIGKLIRKGNIPVDDRRRIDTEDEICQRYLKKKAAAPGFKPRTPPPEDDLPPDRTQLELRKLAADAQYRELKNAQMEGRLVAREAVISGVWNPIETFLVRILSDGAKTISKTVFHLVKSNGTREEVELAIRDELTSFIVPMKESIQKALKLKAK